MVETLFNNFAPPPPFHITPITEQDISQFYIPTRMVYRMLNIKKSPNKIRIEIIVLKSVNYEELQHDMSLTCT